MNKKKSLLIFSLLIAPLIIYFYFLRWKTHVIYGDDLSIFLTYTDLKGIPEKINALVRSEKFRPVEAVVLHFVMTWFGRNLDTYFLFNVLIQVINVYIFATLLNLFLKSPILSIFFSLILGLSRFSFFNISQVLLGSREGLTLTFFLLSLLFVTKAMAKEDFTPAEKERTWIWSLVFANLGMYTHERYIMMVCFVVCVILLAPGLRILPVKRRIILSVIGIGSVFLNVILKKYIYSIPFFVGTDATRIKFSFSSALSFFMDAVLSIFQINSGPVYLVGIPFSSLGVPEKIAVLILSAGLLLILALYLLKVWKSFSSRKINGQLNFSVFLFMLILFGLLLAPAVATVRLEQRWIQASFSVFLLLIVIALTNLEFKNGYFRNGVFSLLITLFIWINFTYLYKGVDNLFMQHGERIAAGFVNASKKGVIHPTTSKIYVWEKQRNSNTEKEVTWSINGGKIFNFYQMPARKLSFIDSVYEKSRDLTNGTFRNFDPKDQQIIYYSFRNGRVFDITADFISDSLKYFNPQKFEFPVYATKNTYDQRRLVIRNTDIDKFFMTGFYNYENGIQWTNGHAIIEFTSDFLMMDSLELVLTAYMPPVCKDIIPAILIRGKNYKEYPAKLFEREDNIFRYRVYPDKLTNIYEIHIISDTIPATPPDTRILSFPFISLELRQ